MKLAETIKKEHLIDRLNLLLEPTNINWLDDYTLVVKGASYTDATILDIEHNSLKGANIPSYLETETSFVIEYAPFTVHVIAYEQPINHAYDIDHHMQYITSRYPVEEFEGWDTGKWLEPEEPEEPEDIDDIDDIDDYWEEYERREQEAEDAYWDEQYEKQSDPTYWE